MVQALWVIWDVILWGRHLNYWSWVIQPKFQAVPVRFTAEFLKKAFILKAGLSPVLLKFKFKQKNGKDLDLFWMDGGITPERAKELDPDVNMNEALGDGPEKMILKEAHCLLAQREKFPADGVAAIPGCYRFHLNKDVNVPEKYPRVEGGMDGHWWQWVDASIAGYGKMEVDSPFVGYAGPLNRNGIAGQSVITEF